MKSTGNFYLSNLDHLRAVAAYLVFCWHFMHHDLSCGDLCYGDQNYATRNPFLALLEQGHTGVALFMCISGYIFMRLVDGQQVHVLKFWYNRLLRLFPLIFFWGIVNAILLSYWHALHGFKSYVHTLFHPGGSWTIYLELRYYALFPLLLFCMRKWKPLPFIGLLLLTTLLYRFHAWHLHGTAQEIAYAKLPGRGDQFLLGSAAYYVEQWILHKRAHPRKLLFIIGGVGLAGLLVTYAYLSSIGGYYHTANNELWAFMPLIDGLCYSAILMAYLQIRLPRLPDKIFSSLGKWSYSLYLNHFFLAPFLFAWIAGITDMPDSFTGRLVLGTLVAFPLVILSAAVTYHGVEKPFLRLRKSYLTPKNP